LPVIAPLAARLGCRLHDRATNPTWNFEFVANVVDNQDRVATSLREFTTPGYATYDIFSFWRVSECSILTAGVRNLTNKNYQTYFDTRLADDVPLITQVFQPGVNFVFGWQYTH
jgi:outer membrane receptor protein involved in Fe transport